MYNNKLSIAFRDIKQTEMPPVFRQAGWNAQPEPINSLGARNRDLRIVTDTISYSGSARLKARLDFTCTVGTYNMQIVEAGVDRAGER
jgi:hypothetical protein